MAEDLIEGPPLLRSDHLRLIHRGGADLAGGYVDDAPQPQIIGGVVDNAQIQAFRATLPENPNEVFDYWQYYWKEILNENAPSYFIE